jgi:hypothetical protein
MELIVSFRAAADRVVGMVALPSGLGDDPRSRTSSMRFLMRFAIVLVGWNFLPPEDPPARILPLSAEPRARETLSENGRAEPRPPPFSGTLIRKR